MHIFYKYNDFVNFDHNFKNSLIVTHTFNKLNSPVRRFCFYFFIIYLLFESYNFQKKTSSQLIVPNFYYSYIDEKSPKLNIE